MSRLTVPAVLAAAALAVGCAGSGYYSTDGTAYATVSTPELAYVAPGVSVVTGYEYPVFYSNNYYWRYDNNRWYRSPYWNRGWTYYSRPPQVITRIDSPYRYRNYRPSYTVRRDSRYYNTRPVTRDNRYYRDTRTYDRNGGYHRDGRTYDRDGRTYDRDGRTYDRDGRTYDRDGRTYDRDGRTYDRDGRTYDRDGGYYRDGRYYDRDGRVREQRR